jgi:MscS family membrane protein
MRVPKAGVDHLAPLLRMGTSFAFVWALWRLTNVTIAWARTRTWATQNASVRSLLAVGYNLARSVIISFGILGVLASLGYPVGTVLAGLGIGGLALAFGAQKTVENLFGSIALAIDQPFRVGDWVKLDDVSGAVEDIGVRSTRLRTADRTLVTIPNGKLADQRVESLSARDRMRVTATVGLTFDTTRAQIVAVLRDIEQMLRAHPRVASDEPTVTFKQFGASSLDIDVAAWFNVAPGREHDLCRQEILLGIIDVIEREGAKFAFPTRTVHMIRDVV